MLINILYEIISNTLKAFDTSNISNSNDIELERKVNDKLKYATDEQLQYFLDKENLNHYWSLEIHGRYKVREELIQYYILNKKIPY